MKSRSFLLLILAAGIALPLMSREQEPAKPSGRTMFAPPPLADDWNKWFVGEWEGVGESETGRGKATARVELGLNGQFRVHHGEAAITEISPQQRQYLKKNMHASDEEIDRFQREPYRSLEVYTIDQTSGEVVGYLFDSLRCMAQGRGRREGNRETIEWKWASGHRSTSVMERVGDDRITMIQKTPMPDGSVMEEKGEMTRKKGAGK